MEIASFVLSIIGIVVSIIGVLLSLFLFHKSNANSKESMEEIISISEKTTQEIIKTSKENLEQLRRINFTTKVYELDEKVALLVMDIKANHENYKKMLKNKIDRPGVWKYDEMEKSIWRQLGHLSATASENTKDMVHLNLFFSVAPAFKEIIMAARLSNENTNTLFNDGEEEDFLYKVDAFASFVNTINVNYNNSSKNDILLSKITIQKIL